MAKRASKTKIAKEAEIRNFMTKLDLTREKAEELWNFDNELISNDVVDEIEAKAKEAVKKPSPISKVKTMKAKKKVDEEKSSIVESIFGFVKGVAGVVKSQEMTASKMTIKTESGTYYSVTITKHKSKPDGFKEG